LSGSFSTEAWASTAGISSAEVGMKTARIRIYQGVNRDWFWRLIAANGKTIADGSEGYRSKSGCRKAVKRARDAMKFSPIEE
jgi:uncharacterized protein